MERIQKSGIKYHTVFVFEKMGYGYSVSLVDWGWDKNPDPKNYVHIKIYPHYGAKVSKEEIMKTAERLVKNSLKDSKYFKDVIKKKKITWADFLGIPEKVREKEILLEAFNSVADKVLKEFAADEAAEQSKKRREYAEILRQESIARGERYYTLNPIITNRPELVRKTYSRKMGMYCYRIKRERFFLQDILVEALEYENNSGQTKVFEHKEVLTGRVISSEKLLYGSAYSKWVRTQEQDALDHLLEKAKNSKERNSLLYAAGCKNPYAAHADRATAWKSFMRKQGQTKFRVGSVRTVTVRAALKLGFKPSIPQPKYWDGYPEGVVEVN